MALTPEEQAELDALSPPSAAPAADDKNPDQLSQKQAAAIGLGRGVTLGAQPILAGAINTTSNETPSKGVLSVEQIQHLLSQSKALADRGIDVKDVIQQATQSPTMDKYQAGRGAAQDLQNEARTAFPKTSIAAQGVGMAATGSLLPGGPMAQGTQQGAIQGFAESPADVSKGQYAEAARNTVEGGVGGGLAGGLVGGATNAIGKGVSRAGSMSDTVGEALGRKALGTQTAVNARGLDTVNNYTDQAVNQGVLDSLSSTKDMLAKVQAIKSQASSGFDAAGKALKDSEAGIDTQAIADQVAVNLRKDFGKDEDSMAFISKLKKDISNNAEDFKSIEQLKDKYQSMGWTAAGGKADGPTADMARSAYKELGDVYTQGVAEAATEAGNPAILDAYTQAKNNWGFATTLNKGLLNRAANDTSITGMVADSASQASRPLFNAVGSTLGSAGQGISAAAPVATVAGAQLGQAGAQKLDPAVNAAANSQAWADARSPIVSEALAKLLRQNQKK